MNDPLDRRQLLKAAGAALLGAPALPAAGPGRPPRPAGLVLGQPQGARAGMEVLAAGGNAVDAAVTAALVAGVVAVHSCGIGGYGGHLVIAWPRGDKVVAIDFNSTAPAAARPEMFPLDGKGAVKGRANAYGWKAAGVPGTLAGLQLALEKYGTCTFAQAVAPAVRYARDGFPVSAGLARALRATKARLEKDPGSARLFFRKGELLKAGMTFRNPELADLLQTLARRGSVDSFYTGDVARRIAEASRKHGGLLTPRDLADYRARVVKPLTFEWNGYAIHTPPPTAGGLTVLQALAALKALGWADWGPGPHRAQARVEALRLAWHDRLRLLGDPRKVSVPVEKLLSERYAKSQAEVIASAVRGRRPVEAGGERRPSGGTIHLSAVDAGGMMVALTLTHGEAFGAKVTVEGLGLGLGHGMSRFDPRPGRPNSVGPGKRPLHNMCPAVVLRGGVPVLCLGATGGRRIPNTLFDVLLHFVGLGRPLAEAVKAPRLHTEGGLDLTLEARWPAGEVDYLKKVGYAVRKGVGATLNAIERDPRTGALRPAAR